MSRPQDPAQLPEPLRLGSFSKKARQEEGRNHPSGRVLQGGVPKCSLGDHSLHREPLPGQTNGDPSTNPCLQQPSPPQRILLEL